MANGIFNQAGTFAPNRNQRLGTFGQPIAFGQSTLKQPEPGEPEIPQPGTLEAFTRRADIPGATDFGFPTGAPAPLTALGAPITQPPDVTGITPVPMVEPEPTVAPTGVVTEPPVTDEPTVTRPDEDIVGPPVEKVTATNIVQQAIDEVQELQTPEIQGMINNFLKELIDLDSPLNVKQQLQLSADLGRASESARRQLQGAIAQGAFGGELSTVGLAGGRLLEQGLIGERSRAFLNLQRQQVQNALAAVSLGITSAQLEQNRNIFNAALIERATSRGEQKLANAIRFTVDRINEDVAKGNEEGVRTGHAQLNALAQELGLEPFPFSKGKSQAEQFTDTIADIKAQISKFPEGSTENIALNDLLSSVENTFSGRDLQIVNLRSGGKVITDPATGVIDVDLPSGASLTLDPSQFFNEQGIAFSINQIRSDIEKRPEIKALDEFDKAVIINSIALAVAKLDALGQAQGATGETQAQEEAPVGMFGTSTRRRLQVAT